MTRFALPWRPLARDGAALLLLAAVPLVAAFVGRRGAIDVRMNLGPGDAPYVSGFEPHYEINDKVAVHWTTRRAEVRLPLEVRGAPLVLRYRFARFLPQPARVSIALHGHEVDAFTLDRKRFQERSVPVPALPKTPLTVSVFAEAAGYDLGVLLDWVRFDVGPGAVLRLRGAARYAPAALVAILFGLLRASGFGTRSAALMAAPWAVVLGAFLLRDPWLTHRLLSGLPLTLALLGSLVVGIGRGIAWKRDSRRPSGKCEGSPESGEGGARVRRDLPLVFALVAYALLLRGAAVNHPDFYYPDLRTHARLALVVRQAGLDFLRSPSPHIWMHGVWRTQAHGKTYAFPYTPAFHVPFALSGAGYDALISSMKLAGAAVSTVPLVLVWALARRFEVSPLGAVLMVLIPTYTSRLSFAFLPALFGHAVDMALVWWLAGNLDHIRAPRVLAAGAALVGAAQLAYVSGVVNLPVFTAALAGAEAATHRERRARRALAVLAMGALGSLLAVAVYYRDFLPMAADVAGRVLSGERGAASRYPVQGFAEVAWARTRDFFDGLYPPLALAGFALTWRRPAARSLVLAWAATYAVLLLGRAKVPDVFLHGHDTLLATPLVCLLAGVAVAWLWSKGSWPRVSAVLLLLVLAVQGFLSQWNALAAQLGNAL
jgi:hypothetical protein